jgi:hypothetical protein
VDDANPWLVVADVARVLEALGLRYAVGGSVRVEREAGTQHETCEPSRNQRAKPY